MGLNSVADLAGRKPNSYSVTAVRTPALTVIPACAGTTLRGPGAHEQARQTWP